ncbi:acyltransferase domain-containing protein [Streptomyces sp. NPDC048506]|uniref:ACP S-malonyltransferase n=1 Tax=Streptomyces sp. NPDC048506 TaxID=3155028 RepID=UPI00341D823E
MNRVAAEIDLDLHYDRTAVAHWLSGTQPAAPVPELIAEALTRRLGRSVSPSAAGLVCEGPAPPGGRFPEHGSAAETALTDLCSMEGDPAQRVSARLRPYREAELAQLRAARRTRAGPPTPRHGPDEGELAVVRLAVRFYAASFDAHGGRRVRSTLATYLADDIATRLREAGDDEVHRDLLVEASRLVFLLARMYQDASVHGLAQRHFTTALQLADEAGDATAWAVVLRGLSAQALALGHRKAALHAAEAALASAGPPDGATRAFLLSQLAVTQASCGQRNEALASLGRAERAVEEDRQRPRGSGPFTSYSPAALDFQSAQVLRHLGDLPAACTALHRSSARRPDDDHRGRRSAVPSSPKSSSVSAMWKRPAPPGIPFSITTPSCGPVRPISPSTDCGSCSSPFANSRRRPPFCAVRAPWPPYPHTTETSPAAAAFHAVQQPRARRRGHRGGGGCSIEAGTPAGKERAMSSPAAEFPYESTPLRRPVGHLFSGQGDFAVSPLVRAARAHDSVRKAVIEVFGQTEDVGREFGIAPLTEALMGQTPPSGRDLAAATVGTPQLALFCSSMAVHRALCDIGLAPDLVLGVSFGEIAALTAAGVFAVPEGARIACLLAHQLAHCAGGMTLIGAPECRTHALLREAGTPELALACVNDPGETVLSGPLPALETVEELARRQGLSASRLRLPFSSHHPSLTARADAFAASIRPIAARAARLLVLSAVRQGPYRPGDDVHRGLADCLVRPARLPGVLLRATARSSALLLEAGTGSALTRNVRHTLPPAAATAHAPLAEPGFPWPHPGAPAAPPADALRTPEPTR